MTDFFADLEREIRAAHPRRSRPVVPVRGLALTAAVAATLVAIVLGLGALSPIAENEVATQPVPDPQPTAVTPADCYGEVVDGRIPDEVVDRFAILRGDSPPVKLDGDGIPGIAAEVIRQSLREVGSPEGRRYVFAIVRFGDANCQPSDLGACLVAPQTHFCTTLEERPLLGHLVDDLPGKRRAVVIMASDDVPRVAVSTDERGVVGELDLIGNTGYQLVPDGAGDVQVTPAAGEEVIPFNCSTAPDLSGLKEQLAIFRGSPNEVPRGLDVNLPAGWHQLFRDEARQIGAYVAFPSTDARCATGVCLVATDDPTAECQTPGEGKIVVTLVRRDGERARVAGLARDGVATVKVTSGGITQEIAVADNLFTFVAPSEEFAVEPGS